MGITFPGYNYLGPGNPTNSGPPVNKVDAIAKQHDEDYDKATMELEITGDVERGKRRIREADERFIDDMKDVDPAGAHEFIGKHAGITGILVKSNLEKVLDTILYPSLKAGEPNNDTGCRASIKSFVLRHKVPCVGGAVLTAIGVLSTPVVGCYLLLT